MGGLKDIGDQLKRAWLGWSLRLRLVISLSSLVGIGAFVAFVYLGSRVSYTPLLTNLTVEDASSIVQRLEALQTPYQLGAGGSAIMVPGDTVHSLRLKLAAEGLPRGGNIGFELFDDPHIGMSRFAEELNYRRALEGELARTIERLDAVRSARVHISMPEKTLFRSQRELPSASVTLQLYRDRELGRGQVRAITHLVGSAIPRLAAERVTVVDSRGAVLTKGDSESMQLEGSLEYQQALEQGLEERVTRILQTATQNKAVSVQATVEVEHTERERTTESFDPDSAVVRTERLTNEQSSKAQREAKGVPGSQSNLAAGASEALAGSHGRRDETREYEINKVTEREHTARGRLKRVSVAALVPHRKVVKEDGTVDYVPREAAELARLTDLVKNAVGFDEGRGDQVMVESVATPEMVVVSAPGSSVETAVRIFHLAWGPLVAICLFMLGLGVVWRMRKLDATLVRAEYLEEPKTVSEMERVLETHTQAETLHDAINVHDAEPFHEENGKVAYVAPPDPDRATAVLKAWLRESAS